MSLVVASFTVGGVFSWILPLAVAALVWTFVVLALGRGRKDE